jgi:MFS family permease
MAEDSRSITDVLQDIIGNVQKVIRAEVRLAKAEVTEEAIKAGRAAGMMAAGAVSAVYAVGFFLLGVLFALALVLPRWAAAFIVFLITAAVAAIVLNLGKKQFQRVHAAPEKTIETIKENVEWAKNQIK